MKTKNSREPPFRFEAHDQQNMAGAISVDQFSPVFQRFDFTLGFVYVIATLHYMLDSDPDRRGRTSVCRRITPFLDQRINAKFAKSMSACLPTGRKRRQSFSPRTQAWYCVSLVNTDDS